MSAISATALAPEAEAEAEAEAAMPVFRVAVVEDEAPVRKSLEAAIRSGQGMALAFSAQSVQEAIASTQTHPAHVYLVDLGLPDADGREFIRWLKRHQPEALPMVVTVFADDEHIVSSFAAGAMGYLLKDASSEVIVQQIIQLVNGGSPISPSVARRMLQHLAPAPDVKPSNRSPTVNPLSEREHEVLCLIEKGLTYDEIAKVLGITWHTVTGYLRRVYKKLEVSSRGEAVFEARQRGLL